MRMPLGYLRSPTLAGATALAVLAFFVISGFLFLTTLYLQEARGLDALATGVALLPLTALQAITSPLTGRVVGARGPPSAGDQSSRCSERCCFIMAACGKGAGAGNAAVGGEEARGGACGAEVVRSDFLWMCNAAVRG